MVPGQSVFLQSGRAGLLVEITDGSNAVVVPDSGGKVTVVKETTNGKQTKLPLSVLKNVEGVAALVAGEKRHGAISGAELASQVSARSS